MTNKGIIDGWIDYVSGQWLNYREQPRLRPSTANLIREMEQMSNNSLQFDEAWRFIEKLEQLHDRFHDENKIYSKELAQTFVECAIAAYKMGNTRESIRFFDGAISNCTDAHDRAAIRWLRGCVYWYTGNSLDAIANWEDALNDFEEQAQLTQRNARWADWYKVKTKEMKDEIKYATEHNFPRPPSPFGATSTGGGPGASGVGASERQTNSLREDFLRAFSVSEEIPAGGFGPAGVDPNPIGHVDIDRVLIDDKPYRIINLRGGSLANFLSINGHRVVKVKGDSMNQAYPTGIENGDFVLLRCQEAASSGDIVAAVIDGYDSCATLKYYVEHDSVYILRPASSNPEYKEREFTKFNEKFHIRGIALAIFKPS